MTKNRKIGPKDYRSFGLIMGSLVTVIGLWPMVLRDEAPWGWFLAVAGILVTLAIFWPEGLAPFYRVWMKIGVTLGWINTRVLLGLGFYGVFTPMGWVMRWMGKDPLRRKLDEDSTTYRISKTARSGSHMQKQF